MEQLEIGDRLLEYDVKRSEEASKARIDVGMNSLDVIIPKGRGLDPEKFLKGKLDWVLKKKQKFEEYKEKIPERNFQEGSKLPVLGREREIVIRDQVSHELTEDKIIVSERHMKGSSLKEKVREILKREAKSIVNEKVEKLTESEDLDISKVYVRDQKTKWGSCSSKNNISINWRLILAPEEVLDYVIAHEIAHLENKNHDEDFWRRVENLNSSYREGYDWLENNNHRLIFSKEDYLERV